MNDGKNLDEYKISHALHQVAELDHYERELVLHALMLYRRDRSLRESEVDGLLRGLEKLKLISVYARKKLMKYLYGNEE